MPEDSLHNSTPWWNLDLQFHAAPRMEMTAGVGASLSGGQSVASFCLILSNVPARDDESHSFRDTLGWPRSR